MTMLKKFGLALLIAASIGGFSSVAMAEVDEGRIVYSAPDAVNLVVGKIKEARLAAQENKSGDEVAAAIKAALDASKEINANDVVDVRRLRANGILKKAKTLAKENKLSEVAPLLEQAQKDFEALHKYI